MGRDTECVRLKVYLNICEEYKSFLWLPAKTASEHAALIFSLYPFESYFTDYNKKNKENYNIFVKNIHSLDFFEGHEGYELICTARNPLKRLFSAYIFSHRNIKNYSVRGFRKFFSETINHPNSNWLAGIKNTNRTPDYFIRQENLLEDYLKIPFVRESKIAKCGVLEEICKKRINFSEPVDLDIKECYTPDMIDYLYNEYKWYFDTLRYTTEL